MLVYYLKMSWLNIKKTPLLTVLFVTVLAFGIAAPVIFESIRSAWSFNPMAYKNERIFAVQLQTLETDPRANPNVTTPDNMPIRLPLVDVWALRDSDIATHQTALRGTSSVVEADNREFPPFRTAARSVDSGYFKLFDLEFLYGAAWDKSVDRAGEQVVVISEQFNQRVFGGGNNVGKELNLWNSRFRVVGITKNWTPAINVYDVDRALNSSDQLFVPFSLLRDRNFPLSGSQYADSGPSRFLQFWVQLDDESQRQAYETFLANYIAEQKQQGRFQRENASYALRTPKEWLSYRQVVDPNIERLVLISLLFMLFCILNCVGILLAKFLRQAAVTGIHRALGAKARDIYLLGLTEVVLLGAVGGTLGFTMAAIALAQMRAMDQRIGLLLQTSTPVVAATLAITLLAALLSGLYPAWRNSRLQPSLQIKM